MTNPPRKDNASSILKETREQKGISLEMVHEATKIPLDALKAIEQGYSVHRLSPFYYRGFIRIYAKYLELDETRVLQSYGIHETVAPRPQPAVQMTGSKPKPKTTPQAIPADDFIKDTLKPLLKRNLTGARLQQVGKFLVLLLGIFVAFKMVGCMMHKPKALKQPAGKVEKEQPTPIPAKTPAKEKSSKAKREETSSMKADHSAVDKASLVMSETVPAKAQEFKPVKTELKSEAKSDKMVKHIELTVLATKSGWLQVKTDGQIVFQSTLKKGAAETWTATDEIELSGKNINLLEFELNGKMLGALGPTDRGAKRVVFTKDGLSVKK